MQADNQIRQMKYIVGIISELSYDAGEKIITKQLALYLILNSNYAEYVYNLFTTKENKVTTENKFL